MGGVAWADGEAWSPPDELSTEQADAIPAGTAAYGSTAPTSEVGVQGFDPTGSPGPAPSDVLGADPAADQTQGVSDDPSAAAAQASATACTLYANDPFLLAFRGRKTVEGSGWQSCYQGVGQRTRACLYKLHHVLLFNRWRKTRCGREVFDRRPTFRP